MLGDKEVQVCVVKRNISCNFSFFEIVTCLITIRFKPRKVFRRISIFKFLTVLSSELVLKLYIINFNISSTRGNNKMVRLSVMHEIRKNVMKLSKPCRLIKLES